MILIISETNKKTLTYVYSFSITRHCIKKKEKEELFKECPPSPLLEC